MVVGSVEKTAGTQIIGTAAAGVIVHRKSKALERIASPGVGRTRLEESQRMGKQARITRATPRVVAAAMS